MLSYHSRIDTRKMRGSNAVKKYNLLILDNYEGYANLLKTAMAQTRSADALSVYWAKDTGTINDIRMNYTIHVAIISRQWLQSGGSFDADGIIEIALLDERRKDFQGASLCRSDPAEKAVEYILALLENRMRIIGVTGVGGGCGKTMAAMALAHQFAREGKRVFFLSLESYMARSPFSGQEAVGLAEVLVALDVAEDLEKTIGDACCKRQRYKGIDTFAISEFNVDRSEITADDVGKLLNAMKRMNRWDVVVVDLDSRMDDRLFEVWQMSARMVLMTPFTRVGAEKLGYVERELYLRERRGEAELQKLVPVLNLCDANTGGFKILNREISLCIPMISNFYPASSQSWCDMLGRKDGLDLFRKLYEEVAR